MKTKIDIDPIFESSESKEFREDFFAGVAITIIAAFILALLLLAIAYGEVIDGAHPLVVIAVIFACLGFVVWLWGFSKDFKHNDQR
jgi:Flp pilus assembly protein TadB